MKTKYFISIAAAMLFMLASLATQAQDVYEYATINYILGINKISVSYSNGKFEELETEKVKEYANSTPALKLIAQMSADGWEAVNAISNDGGTHWRFFLKRKVK